MKLNKCGLATKYPSEYRAYRAMKNRCYNANVDAYPNYGGRGIKVCDRWLGYYGFQNFMSDMGPRPESKTKESKRATFSLDRIDVDGDYSPENCRWADWGTQENNKTSNIFLELNGEKHTITEWSRKLGIKKTTICARLKRGYSVEKALQKPVVEKDFELARLAREHGQVYHTVYRRVKIDGWSIEDALNTPPQMGKKYISKN